MSENTQNETITFKGEVIKTYEYGDYMVLIYRVTTDAPIDDFYLVIELITYLYVLRTHLSYFITHQIIFYGYFALFPLIDWPLINHLLQYSAF